MLPTILYTKWSFVHYFRAQYSMFNIYEEKFVELSLTKILFRNHSFEMMAIF